MKDINREKVLLALLPFWTPQVPPLGIACLKSFLQRGGCDVKTVDINIEDVFKGIYDKYFDLLKTFVPVDNRGNFYNIGNDVLRNHMMAHLNYSDETGYIKLVKSLIFNTFYCHGDSNRVFKLDDIIREFYTRFETCFLGLLDEEKPAVLGLSVYSGTLPASLFAFKLAKSRYPHIKTVMGGGVFADQLDTGSPDFENFLEASKNYLDHIIVGEGEILFLKLLEKKLPESQRVYTLKDNQGEFLDLSSVDIPDFSDFNPRDYPNLTSYASRSCPFQCAFCSETVQWGKYRKKKAAQVVDELIKLYKRHGCQLFLMGDSLLNPIITGLAREFIKTDTAIYWDGYLRADQPVCDMDRTLLWRRGGFYRARLGVESGSQRVLDAMGKKLTPGQIKDAVSSLAHQGIKTTTYWVIGHPGETEEDFRQTLDIIEELKNDIYEAECNPFNYHPSGQVKSGEWAEKNRRSLLYPEDAGNMLVVRTWVMSCEPSRQETFERVSRFVRHCKKLGVPNPYSMSEIYRADERWKKLHKNAVPSLVDFKDKETRIDECRYAEQRFTLKDVCEDDGDFDF
jgi:hypothetical protein